MQVQLKHDNSIIKEDQLAKAGLKMFFKLAKLWKINSIEQGKLLGVSSRQTLLNWRKKLDSQDRIKISRDTLDRLSLIVGIRKAIELLYSKERWNSYMHTPNTYFHGNTPLQHMLTGSMKSLYEVREYLDASRGSHFV